ncbi:hypothetical protein [Pelagibacterium limicola]|uniref:hypothetical protein n=1 Tax=Pelagibacterium limicola TaxID=2791022 RepID=UPI0018AFB6F2|nr:hypothetical protein [Pelagibacterium limicola]
MAAGLLARMGLIGSATRYVTKKYLFLVSGAAAQTLRSISHVYRPADRYGPLAHLQAIRKACWEDQEIETGYRDQAGTLNFGSTASDRRYLRMAFRDRPVHREITRIEKPSRKCQRRITLKNAMSNTPQTPA